MIKGKEAYKEELISRYNLFKSKEEQAKFLNEKAICRDAMRTIVRVFEKIFTNQ